VLLQGHLPAPVSGLGLSLVWADSAYGGELVDWVKAHYGWTLEIVRKPEDQKDVRGFAFIRLAMCHIMVCRLKPRGKMT